MRSLKTLLYHLKQWATSSSSTFSDTQHATTQKTPKIRFSTKRTKKSTPKTLAKHAKKQLSKTPRGVTDKGALPDNMIHFKP